jgi:hypothetical protein
MRRVRRGLVVARYGWSSRHFLQENFPLDDFAEARNRHLAEIVATATDDELFRFRRVGAGPIAT